MIDELRLGGFRSFGVEQRLPFAPLTLLYGQNSSGKSSVFSALMFLRQVEEQLRPLHPGDMFTTDPPWPFVGSRVDLGSWGQASHRNRPDGRMRVGLSVTGAKTTVEWSPGGLVSVPIQPQPEPWRVDWELRAAGENAERTSVAVDYAGLGCRLDRALLTSSRRLAVAALPLLERLVAEELEATERAERELEESPPFALDDVAEDDGPSVFERGLAAAAVLADAPDREIYVLGGGLFPQTLAAEGVRYIRGGDGPIAVRDIQIPPEARDVMRGILAVPQRLVADAVGFLRRVGPLRELPPGMLDIGGFDERGELVHAARDRPSLGWARLTAQLARGVPEGSMHQVDRWLERLDIPYRLALRHAEWQGGGPRPPIEPVSLGLLDVRNQSWVRFQDVGIGVSQVVPVIMQLASPGSTTLIEQPELHLHPRLQTELGELLMEAVTGRWSRQVLVETHSEHLLLRIQRRIREGAFDPSRVSVLYLDSRAGETTVIPMELGPDGEFREPWPVDFFGERLDELL